MSDEEKAIGLCMVRENLDHIPRFDPPVGFRLRAYEPGDEKAWVWIHLLAERFITATTELFRQQFDGSVKDLRERQLYLCAGDTPVGTATAWYGALDGAPCGRVHWVALAPETQGRGLARPLLSAVCLRLAELGHNRAYLTTNSARLPAINLYLKFGFKPHARSDEERHAWLRLRQSGDLKYPAPV